jgi:tetratricopeptide (TPR) repeat protein
MTTRTRRVFFLILLGAFAATGAVAAKESSKDAQAASNSNPVPPQDAGVTASPRTLQQRLEEANMKSKDAKHSEAALLYEQLCGETNSLAHLYRAAQARAANGDKATAASLFARFFVHAGPGPLRTGALAGLMNALKDRKTTKNHPWMPFWYLAGYGDQLFSVGRYHDASGAYEGEFREAPHAEALYKSARAAELSGAPDRALEAYNYYMKKYPSAPFQDEATLRSAIAKVGVTEKRKAFDLVANKKYDQAPSLLEAEWKRSGIPMYLLFAAEALDRVDADVNAAKTFYGKYPTEEPGTPDRAWIEARRRGEKNYQPPEAAELGLTTNLLQYVGPDSLPEQTHTTPALYVSWSCETCTSAGGLGAVRYYTVDPTSCAAVPAP